MKDSLRVGLSETVRVAVDRARTIGFMGEDLRVYATPAMVMDVEIACKDLLQTALDDGESSVGARVEIDHLGPTLNGSHVDITATVAEIDRRRVSFDFEVRDPDDVVGRGRHVRFVVDLARQKERLDAKAARIAEAGKG